MLSPAIYNRHLNWRSSGKQKMQQKRCRKPATTASIHLCFCLNLLQVVLDYVGFWLCAGLQTHSSTHLQRIETRAGSCEALRPLRALGFKVYGFTVSGLGSRGLPDSSCCGSLKRWCRLPMGELQLLWRRPPRRNTISAAGGGGVEVPNVTHSGHS